MHEWSVASSALSSITPMQEVELLHGSKRGKMWKTMSRVFHVSIESAIHPRNSDCAASKHGKLYSLPPAYYIQELVGKIAPFDTNGSLNLINHRKIVCENSSGMSMEWLLLSA